MFIFFSHGHFVGAQKNPAGLQPWSSVSAPQLQALNQLQGLCQAEEYAATLEPLHLWPLVGGHGWLGAIFHMYQRLFLKTHGWHSKTPTSWDMLIGQLDIQPDDYTYSLTKVSWGLCLIRSLSISLNRVRLPLDKVSLTITPQVWLSQS